MPDPLDPFEPHDESPAEPIDDEERAALLDDLADLATRLGHGRVLATGGGGYDRANIANGWSAVVEALLPAPSA